MAKLTKLLREKLTALDTCTAPWDAKHPTNIRALLRLTLDGYAEKTPQGWVITPAGRSILEHGHE